MQVRSTLFKEVLLIKSKIHKDNRGTFSEQYHRKNLLKEIGIEIDLELRSRGEFSDQPGTVPTGTRIYVATRALYIAQAEFSETLHVARDLPRYLARYLA